MNQQITSLREELLNHVDSATTPFDLFSVIDCISVPDLQTYLRNKINQMGDAEIREAHRSSISIQKIIPDDVMRYILSFDHQNRNRAVCHQWNRFNEQLEMQKLQQIAALYPGRMRHGNAWILRRGRSTLNATEVRLGFKGIAENFLVLAENPNLYVESCQEEATPSLIVVYPGEFLLDGYVLRSMTYDGQAPLLNFMGFVVHGVTLEATIQIHKIRIRGNAMFKNLSMKINELYIDTFGRVVINDCGIKIHGDDGAIETLRSSSLTLDHCAIQHHNEDSIFVREGCTNFTMRKCRLFCPLNANEDVYVETGIAISNRCDNVIISGNRIENYSFGIYISNLDQPRRQTGGTENQTLCSIKINENTFCNYIGAVVQDNRIKQPNHTVDVSVEDNMDGSDDQNQKDPNKISHQ